MCLAIPGEIRSIEEGALRTGVVAFGTVLKSVCLAYVPEAKVGDYVIVHAGFAISQIEPERARSVFSYLDEIEAAKGARDR